MDVRSHRGRVPRSRRNELVRASDRLEGLVAVVLLAAGLAAIVVALWIGNATADGERERERLWVATSHPVTATVTGRGHSTPRPAGDGVNSPWFTPVSWTESDGTRHDYTMPLYTPAPMGAQVPVRVDSTGQPKTSDAYHPTSVGFIVGLFALLTAWVALGLLWLLVERLLLWHNLGLWDAEWRQAQRSWAGPAAG